MPEFTLGISKEESWATCEQPASLVITSKGELFADLCESVDGVEAMGRR